MQPKPVRLIHPAHRTISALLAALMTVFSVAPAFALPQGEQVRHGDVNFDRQGNDLIIRQMSPKAIVNYDAFSIGGAESVRFEQPGSGAAILNRVTGGASSTIAGAMLSNGHVYLINPNGILFSSSAQVDVGGLVASAMNLSDENFLAGRLHFSGGGGSVVNQGTINAGSAFLVGGRVENDGTIRAGNILLGAGENSVVIDEVEGGQIRLIIDGKEQGPGAAADAPAAEGTTDVVAGETPVATPGAPDTPAAPAEAVEAVASVAQETAPAPATETQPSLADQIRNDPLTKGLVHNKGILDASGLEGGRVDLGGKVVVQDGVVKADGTEGKGGTLNITAADLVVVTSSSLTTANAGSRGDGGNITVFSPGSAILEAGATVAARGGSTAGNGGQAEVSGRQHVQFSSVVDLSAENGSVGHLLIDPFNVEINNAGPQAGGAFALGVWTPNASPSVILVANLLAQLETGNVTITTTGGGAEAGDITLASVLGLDDLVTTSARTLTLQAHNDILINANISQSNPGGNNVANLVNLILTANSDSAGGGSVVLAADVNTGGGSFTASGVNFTQNATRNLDTAGGAVQLTQTGFVSLLGNSVTTSGGTVTINGAGDSTISSAITTSGGTVSATLNGAGNDWTVNSGINAGGGAGTGSVDIRSNGGTLNLNSLALITTGAGGVATLRSSGAMTLDGDVTTGGGNIDIDVTGAGALNVNATSLLSALGGANAGSIDLRTINGNISLAGGSQVLSGTAGNIAIIAGGALSDVTMAGTVTAGSGAITVSANRDLTHTGSTTSGGGITQLGADMNFDGVGLGSFGGTITLNGSGTLNLRGGDTTVSGVVDTNGNNGQFQARNNFTLSGDVVTDGGSVQLSASSGGAGNILITGTGSLDARGGANTGIATLSNGNGNITNNGEVRSGTAGRLFAQAGGASGVFTQNGIYVGGTEALFGTTVRANNGILVNQPIVGTGIVNLLGNFDGLGGGDVTLSASVSGDGGVTINGASVIGNAGANITAQNSLIDIDGTAGAVDIVGAINSNGGGITINAVSTLDLGTGALSSGGGSIALASGGAMQLFGAVNTAGGTFDADVTGAGLLSIQNDITTSGGNVDITTANGLLTSTAGSDINVSGGAGTGSVRLESLSSTQNLLVGGAVTSGTGGVNLRAGGDVTVGAAVIGGGGTVQLRANTDGGAVGNLTVNAAVSTTGSGVITLRGVTFSQAGTGTIDAASGAVDGLFTGLSTVSRAITSSSGLVTLDTSNNLILNAAVSGGGGVTLGGNAITGNAGGTVTAQNDIQITGTGAVDLIAAVDSNGGDITIGAGTTLDLGPADISSDGGVVTLSSVNAMNLFGPVTTAGGAFNADVTGVGALAIQNDITTSGGNVDITTFNGLLSTTAGSDVNASGGAGTASVRLESLNGGQGLTIGSGITSGTGGANLRAGGTVTVNGLVNGGGGSVQLVANTDNGVSGDLAVNAGVSTSGAGGITLGGLVFSQSLSGTIGAAAGDVSGTFGTSATVSRSITSTTGTVGLNAPTLILNAAISGGGGVTLGGTGITGNAGGTIAAQNNDITITGTGAVDIIDTITSNGGDISIGAGTTLALGTGLISSGGGVVTLTSVNAMDLFGPVTTSGGAFNADVTGTGALAIQNDITTSGGNVDITTFNGLLSTSIGSVLDASGGAGTSSVRLESLNAVQDLSVGDAVLAGSGGLTLRAGNHVTLDGAVTSGGATVLTADSNVGGVGTLSVNAPVQVNGSGTLTLRGRDFAQGATGTLTTSGGFIDADVVNNYVIGQAVNSNGGAVTFLGSSGFTVNAVVSSAPPSGGTGLLVLRGGVTLNAAPVVGNQNVTLNGNGLDLVINTALALGSGADFGANRDVIINQAVSTAAGRSLFINADLNNAVDAATTRGGVLVQGAGSLASGNHLVVKGAHINDAGGLGEAILLAGPGNTLTADGNLLVTDSGAAPVGADVVIGGDVLSTGGSVNVLSVRNIAQQGGADITSRGGDLLVDAGGDFTQVGGSFAIVENGGNLFINAGGSVSLESARNFAGTRGDIAIQAAGNITPVNAGNFELRGDQVSLLSTGGTIGAPGNPLQVEANTLAIGAAGDVVVTAVGFPSLVFDEVPVLGVDTLALNGTVSGSTGPASPVATGTTGGGSFVATSQPAGNVTFDTPVSVTGGGVLVVEGGNVNFNQAVSTAGGSATVVAGNNVAFGANGSLSTSGGSVNLDPGGALTMVSGSFVNSGNGNIRLDAADPSSLGLLDAGTGLISLSAGNLTDANAAAVNLIASAVRLRTVSGAIGASGNALELQTAQLAAESAGGLFIGNDGALTVGTVGPVGVNRVNPLLFAVVDSDATATSDVVATGSLVLDASGALILDDGFLANGTAVQANSGSARLSSGAGITANAAATATGHLSVLADGNLAQNAAFTATGAASTLDVQAGGSITMLDGVIGSTGGGNLRYNAQGGNLTFAGLTAAGAGNLSLLSSGSILGTATGLLTGNAARLEAGTGVGSQVFLSANQVQLQIGTLAALAGAGGISVSDLDSLTVGSVGPLSVNRVGLSGGLTSETDALLSGLDTSAGGNIFAYAAAGALTVDQAVTADGSGEAVLGAIGANSDLTLTAAVNSATGDVVLGAGRDLVINGVTAGTGGGGAIQASATRSVVMNGAARLSNDSGDILLTAGDGIQLGEVFSTSGNVIASASGASGITDNNAAALNLRGASLQLNAAAGSVGSGADPVETETALLAANAGGSIFLRNTGALTVGDTPFAGFTAHSPSGFPAAFAFGGSSDLTAGGSVVLVNDGGLTVEAGTLVNAGLGASAATGNLLLQDLSGSITLRSDLSVPAGNVTVLAADGISVESSLVNAGGTYDLHAQGGDLTFQSGLNLNSAGNNNIRLQASGDVVLANVNAGAGQLHVQAGDDIRMAGAGHTVTADQGRFIAVDAVGELAGNAPIATSVNVVAASAGAGGIHFLDNNAVTVGATGIYGVNRVGTLGGVSALTDGPLSGHTTTANGSIVQRNTSGNLTVASAVSANGTGNIRLAAGAGGAVLVNNTVNSGTGNITVFAQGLVNQSIGGAIGTGGNGTIDVEAAGGSVTLGSSLTAGSGNVRVDSSTAVFLGSVSTSGNASIEAGTSITDSNGAAVNVTANQVRLQAQGGTVGTGADRIETATNSLAARGGAGGVFLANTGNVTTDNVAPVTVNRVGPTGSSTPLADAATLNGISTAANGSAVLVNNGSVNVAGSGIQADGAGNILIQETAGNVTLNGPALTGSGAISVIAAGSVQQNVSLATSGNTIDVQAVGGNITQDAAAMTSTGGGNIRYRAGGAITVASLDTGAGNVSLEALGGAVAEDGDANVDVVANALRVEGSGAGVQTTNPFDTDVNTLAAAVGAGGLNVQNADALTIGTVAPVSVNRVQLDGTALPDVSGANLAGVTGSGNDIEVSTQNGNLTVANAVSNTSANPDDKVFLHAQGADRTLQVNAPVSATAGDVVLRASGDVNVTQNVTGGRNVAVWADDNANNVGNVNQPSGIISAGTLNVFIAGENFTQGAAGQINALNGGVTVNVNSDVNLGSLLTGITALNLAVGANNIIVDTVVHIDETAVLRARTGDILHTGGNPAARIEAVSLGLAAAQDIGQSGNRLRVDTDFLSLAADNIFVQELGSTTAINGTLLITNPGFYPSTGPDCADLIPRPFVDEAEMIALFTGLTGADVVDINVVGDLTTGGLLTAGSTLLLTVGGNLDLDSIIVGGDADIVVGGWMNVRSVQIGDNLTLGVGGFYHGDVADIGGNLDANIGAETRLNVLNVAGNAVVVTGGDFAVDEADVNGNATIDSGADATGTSLDVGGDLALTTRGDVTYDTVDVTRNATIDAGGRMQGDELTVGGNLNADIGRDFLIGDVSVGGNADLRVGGTAEGSSLGVRGALDAVIRGNLFYDDIEVGRTAFLDVGGDIEGDSLDVGSDLEIIGGGDLVFTSLNSGDAEIDVDGSVDIDTIDTGSLDLGAGGSLTFEEINASGVNARIGGQVRMATVNAGGQATFRAGSIVDAGSLVRAGRVSLSASGDIGSSGRKINIDTSNIALLSGNNVFVNNRRGGETTLGLLQARDRAELSVAGSLVDGNGDDVNVVAGSALLQTTGTIGAARDPIDIDIERTLSLAGGQQIPGILWGFFRGELGQPPIRYGGPDAFAPGIAVLNSTVSLINPELNAILLSAESYGDDLVGFKFRNSVFGDFYFLHLYLQVSELADDLDLNYIDYILYGRALVTPDPELPPAARNPIYIGGDEGN